VSIFGIEINKTYLAILLLGLLGLLGVISFDKFHWAISMFGEGKPDFSGGRIVRSVIIFASCLLIIFGISNARKFSFSLDESQNHLLIVAAIVLSFALTLFFALLFAISPSTFGHSALEDGPIEWGSALFLFAACIVMLFVFVRELKNKDLYWFTKLSMLALAGVFFVMGMEEVSWFQRVLDIDTPAQFKGNIQDEMNLHNFATNYVENAYYFGAFVYLVVFPYIRLLYSEVEKIGYFRLFVARPYIALIGALACAYNYDMWNIVFMQITFYASLVIIAYYAVVSVNGIDKILTLVCLLLLILPQWIYLSHGENYLRVWDVTEYREFLMPLAFFIYTLDLAACSRASFARVTATQ